MNKYGLIGKKLGHSLSKKIHEDFFKQKGINASYDLLEVSEEEIEETLNLVKTNYYKGLNVTVPYKETVIKYLDELTVAAKEIKAVNTIYLKDGKLIGDNTDYLGFIKQLEDNNINVENKDVYVLGSGGASKAIIYALKILKANPIVVSRNPEKGISYEMLAQIENISLIINTTPVGMYPNINDEVLDKEIIERTECCIDLIYNPKQTIFLKYSKRGFNGFEMLINQALEAERLWGNN